LRKRTPINNKARGNTSLDGLLQIVSLRIVDDDKENENTGINCIYISS